MTRIALYWLAVMIAFANAVSCSGLSPANKTLYALDPGQATQTSNPARPNASVSRDQVLQVRRVNLAPPYDALSLIYRTRGGTYVKDHYNEWVASPEELFSTELVNFLSASGAFASVIDGRSAAPHRFALETCITSLYGDFQDPQHARIVLIARVYLLDAAGSRSVAYQHHYDIVLPLTGASAHELVLGAGRAYRQLLESLAADLSPFSQNVAAVDAH